VDVRTQRLGGAQQLQVQPPAVAGEQRVVGVTALPVGVGQCDQAAAAFAAHLKILVFDREAEGLGPARAQAGACGAEFEDAAVAVVGVLGFAAGAERQVLAGRIGQRDPVFRQRRLVLLGDARFEAEAVAAAVDHAAVARRYPRPGIRGHADAEAVATGAVGGGEDVHGNLPVPRLVAPRFHFHFAEVLAVEQPGAQCHQLLRPVAPAGSGGREAFHERRIIVRLALLADADRAEAVQRAGIQRQRDIGPVGVEADVDAAGDELGIDIAQCRGGAQQPVFEVFVGFLIERRAGLQSGVGHQPHQLRLGRARAQQAQVDRADGDHRAGRDAVAGAPAAGVVAQLGFHRGAEVAVGAQRGLDLPFRTGMQAADAALVEGRVVALPPDQQVAAHIGAQLPAHALDHHLERRCRQRRCRAAQHRQPGQ
jgi:hypothetical protein